MTATGNGKTHSVKIPLDIDIPPVDFNMRGWAWSDGIGWISFNSQNCDTDHDELMDRVGGAFLNGKHPASQTDGDDPTKMPGNCPDDGTNMPNYGAHMDPSNYEISGYVWSENIGWITFERTVAGAVAGGSPPAEPFQTGIATSAIAKLNVETGILEGWARVTSCPDTECDADSQWGWIKLSGIALDASSSPYRVSNSGSDFAGFAWGDKVLSWISFNSKNCDTDDNQDWDACELIGPAPKYRVYTMTVPPNAAPIASDLSVSFENICAAPFEPMLNFKYSDNEGNDLVQYTINIYDVTGLTAPYDFTSLTPIDGFTVNDIRDNIYQNLLVKINCTINPPTDCFKSYNYIGHPSPDGGYNPASLATFQNPLSYAREYVFTAQVQDEAHLE